MKEIAKVIFWGNTLLDYGIAVLAILISWIVLMLIRRKLLLIFKNLASRSNSNLDDTLVEIGEKFVIPYLYLLINYNIITQLHLSPIIEKILSAALMVITTYYVVRLINFFLQRSVTGYMIKTNELPERITQVSGMLVIFKVIIWGMGIVMLADNLGYNVTTIIAGMGIGGIAIALAAQNILGDLFSYFVIFFDKPFEIGDFIVVDNNSGVVEKIGIKSSHVRSLDGQQLVMPNAEIVKSVIHNYKRLQRRRVVFSIGVVYNTTSIVLRSIPDIAADIIVRQPSVTFDRAHFKSFGDFSVNFEIVYYIESADYLLYMNTQQNICLNIFEKFEEAGIEFAFPTQTLFINNQNGTAEREKKEYVECERTR
ncbi:MAG: mechanosensitive ion channel family protein [Ferruginibacter sp.]